MNLLKKKYAYIQTYDIDPVLINGQPLGFHYGGDGVDNRQILDKAMDRSVLPHYGFSFYDEPPGRVIQKGQGDVPSLYVSNRLLNLGESSLIKTVESVDIFSDYGLSFYRDLSFLIVMGRENEILSDIEWFLESNNDVVSPFPVVKALNEIIDNSMKTNSIIKNQLMNNRGIYEEVHNRNIRKDSGYLDCIYLMADMMTSVVLSYATIKYIIESAGEGLVQLLQIPMMTEGYETILSNVFGFKKEKAFFLEFRGEKIPLWGITPGIFGFEGVLIDVVKKTVSGKRKDLAHFLLMLNEKKRLDERDLRYLV